jgi:hypothetical protein
MVMTQEEKDRQMAQRLNDPEWQWKRRMKSGSCVARLRAWGVRVNGQKLQDHYDLVASQSRPVL